MQTQHPKLQALLAFWNARRNGRPMPGRRDFRAEDLYPWMGNLALNDVQHDPLRIRARLVGTLIVEYEGTDYTGQFLHHAVAPGLRDTILPPYEECVLRRSPVSLHYEGGDRFGRWTQFDRLMLPLSADGDLVDMILVGLYGSHQRSADGRRQPVLDPCIGIARAGSAPGGLAGEAG